MKILSFLFIFYKTKKGGPQGWGVEFENFRTPLVWVGVHPIIPSTTHLLAPSQPESQLRLTKPESTLSNFICYFHAFNDFFELNDPEIEKHYKWTLKRLKLGMVSSFHPDSMCYKVERVTAKTGCTSCTNWTISFEVSRFQTKTRLLQMHFIFLNLFQLQTFCAFNMHHTTTC